MLPDQFIGAEMQSAERIRNIQAGDIGNAGAAGSSSAKSNFNRPVKRLND
jgi:hypothetical protein